MWLESIQTMAKKKTDATTPAAAPRRRVASKATANDRAADPAPLDLSANAPAARDNTPTYEQIAEAAYLRYLRRGGSDGRDFDDWLEAERELRSR